MSLPPLTLEQLRREFVTVETWDLEVIEVPDRVRRFDRLIAEIHAEIRAEERERIADEIKVYRESFPPDPYDPGIGALHEAERVVRRGAAS